MLISDNKPVSLESLKFSDKSGNLIVDEGYMLTFGNDELAEKYIQKRYKYWQKILGIDLVIAPNMNETLYEIEVVKVLKLVARFFNIPYRILTSKSRKREYVDARRIAINICKARNVQDSVISRVAKMDHSTVVFHKKKFIELCETDKKFIKMFDDADEFVTNHFKYDNQ